MEKRKYPFEGNSSPRISRKNFQAYPGVIFNYTQPAEDAVDEASPA